MNRKWLDEFIKFFSTGDTVSISKAFDIKDKYIPRFLFRYTHLNPDEISNRVFALESIIEKTIYLTEPQKCNDPLDSFADLSASSSINNLESSVILDDEHNNFYAFGIQDIKKALVPDYDAKLHEYKQALKERIKIHCFTGSDEEEPMNMPMWYHYADEYRGLCIKYETAKLPRDVREKLFPIEYGGSPINIRDLDDLSNMTKINRSLIRLAMKKNRDWSYEQEWRLIYDFGITSIDQKLPFDAITKIFTGPRMSNANRCLLNELSKTASWKLFNMKVNKDGYNTVK